MPCPVHLWLVTGEYTPAAHARVRRCCAAVVSRFGHALPLSVDDLASEVWLSLRDVQPQGKATALVYRTAHNLAVETLRRRTDAQDLRPASVVDDWRPNTPGLRRNRDRAPLAVRLMLYDLARTHESLPPS